MALRASFLERENSALKERIVIVEANNCNLDKERKELWDKLRSLEKQLKEKKLVKDV